MNAPLPDRLAILAALVAGAALAGPGCTSDDAAERADARPEAAGAAAASLVVDRGDGVFAVPGLHDAHLHLVGIGHRTERADLRGATSVGEVRERMKKFLEENPDAPVLDGRGWDQSLFEGGQFPTASDLEGVLPDDDRRPIVLTRVDGHALWANRAALEAAGLGPSSVDPEGGKIHRDEEQNPTGILVDNAMSLVRNKLPPPTEEDRARWLLAGIRACEEAGLVAGHDMGMSLATWRILEKMGASGQLEAFRVFAYLDGSDDEALELLEATPRKPASSADRVVLMGAKLYADGAMGSRGAALLDDYSDDPGNRGLLVTEPSDLDQRVRRVHDAGYQVAIHAIGDRGVRAALDAIDKAQGDDTSRRHRIEHAQLVAEEDFARMKRLGVVASMQPTHATSDMRWAEARVGPERIRGAYAWRRMLDEGIPLAFGSDAPVESHRPAWGLFAAITRTDHEGQPVGGWRPDQKLDLDEALAAFSRGAIYAVGREEWADTDFTLLGFDPRGEPAALLRGAVVGTEVGGLSRVDAQSTAVSGGHGPVGRKHGDRTISSGDHVNATKNSRASGQNRPAQRMRIVVEGVAN